MVCLQGESCTQEEIASPLGWAWEHSGMDSVGTLIGAEGVSRGSESWGSHCSKRKLLILHLLLSCSISWNLEFLIHEMG